METADQTARKECITGSENEQIECFRKIAETIDIKNTKRLNEIFNEFGFPGIKLVGKAGLQAYLILLQHTISDELRIKSLKPIEKAFRRKEMPPDAYANYVDRLRVHLKKPQLYGQSFSFKTDGKMVMDEVIDLKNLDKRRRKIGLPPIAEYAKESESFYRLRVEIPKTY